MSSYHFQKQLNEQVHFNYVSPLNQSKFDFFIKILYICFKSTY